MENKVDLNSASLDELTTLPGIGRKLASRLIQYRSTVGRFRTVEEMTAVPGITKELLDRFSDRVRTGEASEAEMELPPLRIAVTLTQPTPKGDYFGHRMAAIYTHRERVPGVDGEIVSLWVIGQSSEPLARDGTAILLLPNLADLQGDVNFQVTAPDGENLLTTVLPAAKLTEKLGLTVQPKAAPTTQPTTDPAFGQPTRLRGRVIDRAGKVQIANRQVVIWGASKPNPQPADFIALIVVQTDNSGYFSGPYPLGSFTSASGDVSISETPISVPIHLESNVFPPSVILVVDLPDGLPPEVDEQGNQAPRDPDMADLARADGVFSSEFGPGQCVDFTKPNRVLEEFSYSYVVRTTQPDIKGLTLEEPEKIDIRQIAGILGDVKLGRMERMTTRSAVTTDVSGSAVENAEPTLTTQRIDARILQTLARDPDGFTLTKVANAAHLTAHGDLLRLIAKHLKVKPDRGRLTCEAPVDWDDEPTIYQACDIAHGHLLHFKQEWVADGYSMGNLLYSLPLAPGQKKQVAILDWERRETAARTEAVVESEELQAAISRDRDINEVVRGTVSEHVSGGSSASTGSFGAGLGRGSHRSGWSGFDWRAAGYWRRDLLG